jgi:putative ABC transport system permease protein
MDFRFALRSLGKNPGFTVLAVLVMALGIGANTAVFSVVNSVLLKPLGYRDPDRIVTIRTYWKHTGGGRQISAPDFHDWHSQSDTFDALAYYNAMETVVSAGPNAEYGRVAWVSRDFLRVFDVQPSLGRFFNDEELKPGSAGAVVISDAYWRSHYAANPEAIGQTVRVLGRPMQIVGVLPPRFQFPDKTDIWFPTNTIRPDTTSRSAHNYRAIARLKPGIPLDRAQSQMTAITARLEQQWPDSNKNKSALVTPMRDAMVGDVRTTLYLLLGAVALVLLIACANVANLLLAKATGRGREMAIRAAIGASRGRIVRLLAVESLLLALVSGALGVVFAIWGSNALVALAPSNVPRLDETAIDGSVLAFTFVASLVASVLFGLTPALHASRVDLNDALKQGANRVMGGGAGRMRSAMVVAEIALSVVLLCGAGLLIKSFVALHNVALGFQPERVLVMASSVPATGLEEFRRATRFYKDLLAQAATLPGVIAVGAMRTPPGQTSSDGSYFIDNLPANPSVTAPQAVFTVAAPGAMATLNIPIRRGRDLSDRDTYDAPFVTLINEALARKSFPGQDPIGRMIYCGFDSPKPMQIVGVVGDVRQRGPASEPAPEIIMPYEQHPGGGTAMRLLVRTAADPGVLAETLRRKARELSADVPIRFTTMEEMLSDNVAAPRFRTLLFGIFAALAVCLAMAGVYGVMSYVVSQRSNEIGLRMALGASPSNVLGLVMRQGLILAAAGLAIGLAASVAATRLLSTMLFAVKPTDPLTYAAVAVLLTSVALLATYLPARRALQVDPLTSLRQE